MEFALRAHNHNYKIDPIVRSLLDTDMYKILMQAFQWERYPNEIVRFRVTNRTKSIRVADLIDVNELREQLDHARTLRFTPSELIWLRGQTFYGKQGIFKEGYLHALKTFQLPEYTIGESIDGQYDLTFEGPWWEVTMWEIHALTIINELRYRSLMKTMTKSELDIMFARAKVKLYAKLEELNKIENLNFTDFGTRRRFSFLWQEYCVTMAKEVLGNKMTGTSNVYLAMKHDIEAKGTTAHELSMVFAALAQQKYPGDENALRKSQYEVLHQWANQYHQNLLIFLPDSFGTTQFLKNAPWEVSTWTGARPDSKDPYVAGDELIKFFGQHAPCRTLIFADGLDVKIPGTEPNGHDIVSIEKYFRNRAQIGFGMGTNLTCDFIGCHPHGADIMRSISIVAKVDMVNRTHPAVKLSDIKSKATGPQEQIDYYRSVFGEEGVVDGKVPSV